MERLFNYSINFRSELIDRLLEIPDCLKFLEDAIVELENFIDPETRELDNRTIFDHVLWRDDIEFLAKKYGLRDSWDIEKIDIEDLLDKI